MTESPDMQGSQAPGHSRPRRSDVEGLRIVAVALVLVYHYLGLGVSGGVDVFLFISGYFVLGGLARRLGRGEGMGLRSYYLRTVRRLFPAAWLTLAVVLSVALAIAYRGQAQDLMPAFRASVLYFENWWLADRGVAYGAASSVLNPFQHFWSLSVQAQVFLVAPLALILLAPVRWRRREPVSAKALSTRLALATVVGLGVATVLVGLDQTAAYFDTRARAWQFLGGAALALLPGRIHLPHLARVIIGWFGLAALVTGGLLVDGLTTFPGPWALVPLGAAAAVLITGDATPARHTVGRFLAHRSLASNGKYAYGLYLWHWPVMSLYLSGTGRDSLDLLSGLAAAALSMLLAVVTYHVVEAPLRVGRRPLLAAVVASALAASAVVGVVTVRSERRWVEQMTALADGAELSTYPGMMAAYRPDAYPVPEGVVPIPRPHAPVVGEEGTPVGCQVVGNEDVWCMFGNTTGPADAQYDVALIGGSHSGTWHGALSRTADDTDVRLTSYIRAGCPFLLTPVTDVADYYNPDWAPGCDRWNELLLETLLEDPPDLVVTTYSRPFGPHGEVEWVPQEYVDAWAELGRHAIPVLAIRANAQLPSQTSVCDGGDEVCSYPRREIYGDDTEVLRNALPDNVTVLDLTHLACSDGICPTVVGNVRVYADQTHLTAAWAKTGWPIIGSVTEALLRDDGRRGGVVSVGR